MDGIWYYAIPIAILALLVLVRWIFPSFTNAVYSTIRVVLLKYGAYRLFRNRDYCGSVNYFQLAMFILYIIANVVGMSTVSCIPDAMVRAGKMAIVNMVPLFLGGRTSFVANWLGISLQSYYLCHHWIGRIVLLESLIHLVLALVIKPPTMSRRTISAILLSIALTGTGLFSISTVRRSMFEGFLVIHYVFVFSTVVTLMLHILPTTPATWIFPTIALGFWTLNVYFRWRRTRKLKVSKLDKITTSSGSEVIKLELEMACPEPVRSGQYVYLKFRSLYSRDKVQTHPFMISWFDNVSVEQEIVRAKKLTFLIEIRDGLTARMARESYVQAKSLEGPYGKNLDLAQYTNVILVAEGLGIAGVLSYARELVLWKARVYHRVYTRKLDIYWKLETNEEEKWVGDEFEKLRKEDASLSTRLTQLWCYFPKNKTTNSVFQPDQPKPNSCRFCYLYPDEFLTEESGKGDFIPKKFDEAVKYSVQSVGSSIIVACGPAKFTRGVRKLARDNTNKEKVIEFVESEYRPNSTLPVAPVSTLKEKNLKISGPLIGKEITVAV